MKKVMKKALPFMLALMCVFGSCMTVFAAESATLDLSRLKGVITGSDYALYKYQCVYTDGKNFYLSTSAYPIDAYVTGSQDFANKWSWYYYHQFLGDYAIYKVPLDYSKVECMQHGRASSKVDINTTLTSYYGYPDNSKWVLDRFTGSMLAANFDMVGHTKCTDRFGDDIIFSDFESFFFATVTPIQSALEILPLTVLEEAMKILPVAVFCLGCLIGCVLLRRRLPGFLG